MAYIKKDKPHQGPFPNLKDEYCGNTDPNSPPRLIYGEDPIEAVQRHRDYLATMRFGRPRPTHRYTTAQLMEMGYVGLYLKQDGERGLLDGEIQVPTPPELMEPSIEER